MQKRYVSIVILAIIVALVISVFAWASLNRSMGQQAGQLKALVRGDRGAPVFKSPRLPLAKLQDGSSTAPVVENSGAQDSNSGPIIPVTGLASSAPVAQQYQYAVVTPPLVAQQYQYAFVQPAPVAQQYQYAVLTPPLVAQQYQYAVVQPAPVAQQYQYAVLTPPLVAQQYQYAFVQPAPIAQQYQYAVVNRLP